MSLRVLVLLTVLGVTAPLQARAEAPPVDVPAEGQVAPLWQGPGHWWTRIRETVLPARDAGAQVAQGAAAMVHFQVLLETAWPMTADESEALAERLGWTPPAALSPVVTRWEEELAEHLETLAQLAAVEELVQRGLDRIELDRDTPWWLPSRLVVEWSHTLLLAARSEVRATRLQTERNQVLARQALTDLAVLQEVAAAASLVEGGATARLDAAAELTTQAQARANAIEQRAEEERIRAREEAARQEEIAETEQAIRRLRAERVEELSDAASSITRLVNERREFEDRLGALQQEHEADRERFTLFEEREASIGEMLPADPSRAERADRLLEDAARLRSRQRDALRNIRPRLQDARAARDVAEAERARAEGALQLWTDTLADRDEPEDIAALGTEVRETHAETATLQRDLAQLRLDTLRDERDWRMRLLRTEAERMDRLHAWLPRSRQVALQRLTTENFERVRDNLHDRTLLRLEEFEAFAAWMRTAPGQALSVDGFVFSTRFLMRLLFLLALWWVLLRYRDPVWTRSLERVERQPALRRSLPGIFKTAEVLHALVIPTGILLGLRWLLDLWTVPEPWRELIGATLVLLWLAIAAWRITACIMLPASARKQRLHAPGERSQRWNVDLFALQDADQKRVLVTARLLLLVFLGGRLLTNAATLLLGEDLLTSLLRRVLFWTLVLLVYVLSWLWRKPIVESFLQLSRLEEHRVGELLRRHRDRPYSVLILAFLLLYVLASAGFRRLRSNTENLSISRRVQNFLFRKRVELAQSSDRANQPWTSPLTEDETHAVLRAATTSEIRVDRPEERERILRAFTTWQRTAEAGGAVAVIGEPLSGKSTFLDEIESTLPVCGTLHTTRLQTRLESASEVYAWLGGLLNQADITCHDEALAVLRSGDRRVFIVDDAHMLFLRRIGGFKALDAFLDLVSLTRTDVFWVLSFSFYGWRYFNRVLDRRHFFADIVHLAPLSDAQTRMLIERRAAASGFALDFTRLLTTDTRDTAATFEVIKSADGYYRLLNEFAEGNPAVALAYWIRSLHDRDDQTLFVQLFAIPSALWLRDLADAQLFLLTAIAQHESVRVEELATVLSRPRGAIDLDINLLEERGVLTMDSHGLVTLRPGLLRQVLGRLRDANLLYFRR